MWIEGLEDSTRQRFTGPMTQVTMSPLKPVHEYTVVVDVENNAGAHRIVKKNVHDRRVGGEYQSCLHWEDHVPERAGMWLDDADGHARRAVPTG